MNVWNVKCPICGSVINRSCGLTKDGEQTYHVARYELANGGNGVRTPEEQVRNEAIMAELKRIEE